MLKALKYLFQQVDANKLCDKKNIVIYEIVGNSLVFEIAKECSFYSVSLKTNCDLNFSNKHI